jgi:hypothetical protein
LGLRRRRPLGHHRQGLPRKPGFGMKLKPGIAARCPYVPGTYWKKNPNLPEA